MKKEKKGMAKSGVVLLDYFEQQRLCRKAQGSVFTAVNYQTAKQSVRRFLGEDSAGFVLEDITKEWLLSYILYMRETDGLCPNSARSYFRILRAVYNRAIIEGVISKKDADPFLGVSIIVPPTRKRALSAEGIQQLMQLDLSKNKKLVRSRDLFVFLFIARGMCFVDVFNLRWKDIQANYIYYQRSKTKAVMNVRIEPEMQKIIDLYGERGGTYVFPFLHRNCYDPLKEVTEPTSLHRYNRHLKKLGELLGLEEPLTSYVQRHSWASLAVLNDMGTSLISQGLGHHSEITTRIYLRGFSSQELAEANARMLDKVIRKEEKEEKEEICLILKKSETSILLDIIHLLKITPICLQM